MIGLAHWQRFSIALLLTASSLVTAQAKTLTVPLHVDHAFIQQALQQQVFTGPNGTTRPWDDGTGCNSLTLAEPRVDAVGDKLRVRSRAEALIGTPLGGQCLVMVQWQGVIETYETLIVSATQPVLTVRVADTQLLNSDGSAANMPNLLWASVKDYVHPRLESIRIDLTQPIAELKQFLPSMMSEQDATRIQHMLDSLRFTTASPSETGVTATVQFEVDDVAPRLSRSDKPSPLTPDEVAQWERYVESWDSFFTFVVRHAVADSGSPEVHRDLLELLLDTRYALTETLDQPSKPGFDPVRHIFLDTWQRLTPILRRIGTDQANNGLSLQYLSFIASGDALKTLDELGPEAGIEISQDGLRRLARMVAPADQRDPLGYDTEMDAELRRIFDFGEPLPAPEDNPEIDLLNWLFPPAWAADDVHAANVKRLNKWVPKRDELPEYLPLVRDVLLNAAAATLEKTPIDAQFHDLFRHLTLSTAWQESCWRQYVARRGKLTPMRSQSGSVGIMQINPRVWRGFYDVKGLKTDIAYNARAGTEILMHYLRDLAIAKNEHTKTKKTDNLARASYSAYNAGPRELTRYRDPKAVAREKRVDNDFWEKYQAIKKGNELAVMKCFGV